MDYDSDVPVPHDIPEVADSTADGDRKAGREVLRKLDRRRHPVRFVRAPEKEADVRRREVIGNFPRCDSPDYRFVPWGVGVEPRMDLIRGQRSEEQEPTPEAPRSVPNTLSTAPKSSHWIECSCVPPGCPRPPSPTFSRPPFARPG